MARRSPPPSAAKRPVAIAVGIKPSRSNSSPPSRNGSSPRLGPVPRFAPAAQHSDAAKAHSKLAAQHSDRAAALARDAERERPRRR